MPGFSWRRLWSIWWGQMKHVGCVRSEVTIPCYDCSGVPVQELLDTNSCWDISFSCFPQRKKQQLGLKRLSWFKWVSHHFYTYLQFHHQSAEWAGRKDSQLSFLVKKDDFLYFLLMLLLSVLTQEQKNISMPQGGILEMPLGWGLWGQGGCWYFNKFMLESSSSCFMVMWGKKR